MNESWEVNFSERQQTDLRHMTLCTTMYVCATDALEPCLWPLDQSWWWLGGPGPRLRPISIASTYVARLAPLARLLAIMAGELCHGGNDGESHHVVSIYEHRTAGSTTTTVETINVHPP